MKKLLAIILVVLMSVSVMLFTACNKDQGDASSSSAPGRQSSSEEESSTRRRGDGASSSSIGGNSTSNGSSTEDNSSSLENGNSSQENPNTSSSAQNPTNSSSQGDGTSSSYQPSSGSNVYGTYPYSYSTSVKDVAFDINLEYTFVDNYILSLEKPSLNGTFYDALVDAEDAYNALSASDKGMVANYSRLVEARTAYDDMASQEATSLINQMSEPSLDNLSQFASEKAKIQFLLDKMSSTSSVSNLSSYNTKVQNSSAIVINEFSNAVSAISSFEYSPEYKQKLDNADNVYQIVLSVGLENQVTSQKTTLDSMKIKYDNRGAAVAWETKLNSLPAVNSITADNKSTIKSLKIEYNTMAEAVKNEVSSTGYSTLQTYLTKMNELWPQKILYLINDNRAGNEDFVFASKFGTTSDDEKSPGMYEGQLLTEGTKFKIANSVTFKTNDAAVLTVVANIKNNKSPGNFTVSLNGTIIETVEVTYKEGGVDTEYVVSLPSNGTYVLNSTNDDLLIFLLCVE